MCMCVCVPSDGCFDSSEENHVLVAGFGHMIGNVPEVCFMATHKVARVCVLALYRARSKD